MFPSTVHRVPISLPILLPLTSGHFLSYNLDHCSNVPLKLLSQSSPSPPNFAQSLKITLMFSKKVQWHQPLMNSLHLHLGPCFLLMISISFSNHLLTPSRVLCSLLSVGICYSPFNRIIYEKQNVWRQKGMKCTKLDFWSENSTWNKETESCCPKTLSLVEAYWKGFAPSHQISFPRPQSPWRALSVTSPVKERGFSEENWLWEC